MQGRRIRDSGYQGCATAVALVAGTIAYHPLDRRVKLNTLPPDLYFGVRVLLQGHCMATARVPRIPFPKLIIPSSPPLTPFQHQCERAGIG